MWCECCVDAGALASHPNLKQQHNPDATVTAQRDWVSLDSTVTAIVIDSYIMQTGFNELDLSRFSQLQSLEVGDYSLSFVEEVSLVGMSALERVLIGENSFTKNKYRGGEEPDRRFCVRDCPSLKEVRVGRYSFSDYSVCEIENNERVEVIEMGDLNEISCNFMYASFLLKGMTICNR